MTSVCNTTTTTPLINGLVIFKVVVRLKLAQSRTRELTCVWKAQTQVIKKVFFFKMIQIYKSSINRIMTPTLTTTSLCQRTKAESILAKVYQTLWSNKTNYLKKFKHQNRENIHSFKIIFFRHRRKLIRSTRRIFQIRTKTPITSILTIKRFTISYLNHKRSMCSHQLKTRRGLLVLSNNYKSQLFTSCKIKRKLRDNSRQRKRPDQRKTVWHPSP